SGIAPSSSAAAATSTATTTGAAADNACSNPVLASDLRGWGSLDGAQASRDAVSDLAGADWAFATSGDTFYLPELSVSPGETWTFSAMDRLVDGSGAAKIGVDWYG